MRGLTPGELYPAEEIALYGATGLCGLPPSEISGLLRNAFAEDGSLSLERFGQIALRRIRPVLSFKILANMPVCFVSIFENLRGPNAVYTPWEGQGAQAIAAGVRAVAEGEVPCAVVGGCDVKTHAFAFASLRQLGMFDSWQRHSTGCIPGEGAAFLVLEGHEAALRRGAKVHAVVRRHTAGSVVSPRPLGEGPGVKSVSPLPLGEGPGVRAEAIAAEDDSIRSANRPHPNPLPKGEGTLPNPLLNGEGTLTEVFTQLLRGLEVSAEVGAVLAGDGDPVWSNSEQTALEAVRIRPSEQLRPKSYLGNLFAAAAAVQVALAALLAQRRRHLPILANCFGYGAEQAAFLLEAP